MKEFPPLVLPPAVPITVPDEAVRALPANVGEMVGKGRARDAVLSSTFRPADVGDAQLSAVEKIWVPLWRVEGTVDGFHLGIGAVVRNRRPAIYPTGGYTHHDGVPLVLGRRAYPIDPAPKARIPQPELLPLESAKIPATARVLPDVDADSAKAEAEARLRRRGEPNAALYAKVTVEIRSVILVYYPLWVIRYWYGGEAVDGGDRLFHAAVSAFDGKIVSEHHPSAWRAIGGKIRRLFG